MKRWEEMGRDGKRWEEMGSDGKRWADMKETDTVLGQTWENPFRNLPFGKLADSVGRRSLRAFSRCCPRSAPYGSLHLYTFAEADL